MPWPDLGPAPWPFYGVASSGRILLTQAARKERQWWELQLDPAAARARYEAAFEADPKSAAAAFAPRGSDAQRWYDSGIPLVYDLAGLRNRRCPVYIDHDIGHPAGEAAELFTHRGRLVARGVIDPTLPAGQYAILLRRCNRWRLSTCGPLEGTEAELIPAGKAVTVNGHRFGGPSSGAFAVVRSFEITDVSLTATPFDPHTRCRISDPSPRPRHRRSAVASS